MASYTSAAEKLRYLDGHIASGAFVQLYWVRFFFFSTWGLRCLSYSSYIFTCYLELNIFLTFVCFFYFSIHYCVSVFH